MKIIYNKSEKFLHIKGIEVELDVEHRSMEVDGVRGDLDCVSDAVKSEEFHVLVENIVEGASLCLLRKRKVMMAKKMWRLLTLLWFWMGLSGENGAMFLFQSCNYPFLQIFI